MGEKVKVGVVGCGAISGAYFRGCQPFDIVEVAVCADLDATRARAKAEEFAVPRACTVRELLADPDIRIVLNLTTPKAHTEINLAAIDAGKSVYVEKPLAVTCEEGRRVLDAARRKDVLVGCAPDTFLGGGGQTCRRLIDEGVIGEPAAAVAFMAGRGHESWHPSPEFYYKPGGGPMFDMGPYYLTALVNLIGPVRRVTGSTRVTFPERTITSEPLKGTIIRVETATHVAGVMDFACGAVGTVIMSFDVVTHNLPMIQVYGTEGSMSVPNPNTFRGPVRTRRMGEEDWTERPLTHSEEVGRGIGVADMACALVHGRPHRASGELAYHVLEVMQAFETASRSERHVHIESTCTRPAPLPAGLMSGELDT